MRVPPSSRFHLAHDEETRGRSFILAELVVVNGSQRFLFFDMVNR